MITKNVPQNKNTFWTKNHNVFVRGDLLSSGVVVISDNNSRKVQENIFSLNSRNYQIFDEGSDSKKIITKHQVLLSPLAEYASRSNHGMTIGNRKVIRNKERRDEAFSSIIINNKIAFYIYPWAKNFSPREFNGFYTYSTAACMLGGALRGVSEGEEFVLIKHDLKLTQEDVINEVNFDQTDPSPYESVLSLELEKLAEFISATSTQDPSKKPELFVHLPYYDYLLFFLDLFEKEKITQNAVKKIFAAVRESVPKYRKNINEKFKRLKITVTICSPFDFLFDSLIDSNTTLEGMRDAIDKKRKNLLNENTLTKKIIYILKNSNNCSTQEKIWQDFLRQENIDDTFEIESLFKLGNAVVPAMAAYGLKNHQSCSFLTVTEKQIAVSCEKRTKHLKNSKEYPEIFNITTLDSAINHTCSNHSKNLDSMFYLNPKKLKGSLTFLTESDVLNSAIKNIGVFAKKTAKTDEKTAPCDTTALNL